MSSSKACFIANFRSWEHARTHTQGLITVQDLHQVMQPTYTCFLCTRVWRLAFRLCTLVCF